MTWEREEALVFLDLSSCCFQGHCILLAFKKHFKVFCTLIVFNYEIKIYEILIIEISPAVKTLNLTLKKI